MLTAYRGMQEVETQEGQAGFELGGEHRQNQQRAGLKGVSE